MRKLLEVARDMGVSKLKVSATGFEAEFTETALALVGMDGKPVDLDEGMPELARDPERDEPPADENFDTGQAIHSANFQKPV